MELKSIFTDEDAVSPVIGVILMVAITVILAAVIGAFVLGIGGSQENVPQASWEWGQGSSAPSSGTQCDTGTSSTFVDVTHKGGDEIDGTNLELDGSECSGTINAGSTLYIQGASSGDTINLVWTSPSSDDTNVISDYEVS